MKDILNKWGKEKVPFVFIIDYELNKPMCWKIEDANSDFKFKFNGVTNTTEKHGTHTISKNDFSFVKSPISFETYLPLFNSVKEALNYGNSFLINLTCETPVQINCSLETLFYCAHSKYKCWLKNEFVSFSPETFIKIIDQKIYSYPMKGTIDGSIKNAKQIILNDPKEIAEHATIVDLIRNDLSKVSQNVSVPRYRYYEEILTNTGILGQVSSEITGNLPANFNEHIGDILFELLPAGSISGAPKEKTVAILSKIETSKRGYYTGIGGYFDGENLDSCVLIRYLQEDKIYRSGGGITFQSDARNEYNEMLDKIYVPLF